MNDHSPIPQPRNPQPSPPAPLPPEVIERFESLDDLIFSAIDGDEQALAHAGPAWREAVEALGPVVVQESRREYLRYARSTWEFLRRNSAAQSPRVLAVVQLIAMLSGVDL